jgi:hypothetical protein
MFSAVWKMLGAAAIVTRFHTARILPQDEHERKLESDHTVKKLVTFIPKLGVEVELDKLTCVDNEAIVAGDQTG